MNFSFLLKFLYINAHQPIHNSTPIRKHPCATALVICSIQLLHTLVSSSIKAKILIQIMPNTAIPKKIPAGREKIWYFSTSILTPPVKMPIRIYKNPTGITIRICRFNQVISLLDPAIMTFHSTFPAPAREQHTEPIRNTGFLYFIPIVSTPQQ